MGLFRPDLYRFFALGFLGGAALIFAHMDHDGRGQLIENLVPSAEAAPAN